MMSTNAGDLARAVTHDPGDEWPSLIEIVAYWNTKNDRGRFGGRRGRRRSVQIDAEQFFGRGQFGAPMSGEQLIGMVDRLRKQGPDGQLHKGEFRKAKKTIGV